MIRLILVVLAIAVALGVAPMLIGETGYVLISFNKTTIEGSIVAFCAVILFTAVVAYLCYKLVRYLWSFYSHTRHRFFARSEERKQAAIEQGVWSLLNGDSKQLELALEHNSVSEQWQDVRYALLAQAAIQQKQTNKAVDWLDNISAGNQLKAAKLWLATGDSSTIIGELKALAESKHATTLELKLYAEVLVQQQKWTSLVSFMPRLVRKKALSGNNWQSLFSAYFRAQSASELTGKYNALGKKLKPLAQQSYLIAMAQTGQLNKIEITLLKMLKDPQQQQNLAQVLRLSAPGDALKLQSSIQDELKKSPENDTLLLALACLANAHGEYDLASRVFDKVLTKDNRGDYLTQAQLSYSQSAQPKKALALYVN